MTKQERWITVAVVASVVSVVGLAMRSEHSAHTHCGKVVTVGGCGSDGYCGLMLDSGLPGSAKYPVVGQSVCVRCRLVHEVGHD
jgi:hypothetical protein